MNTSQEIQDKPAGNTKTAGPKHQLYRWCFTLSAEKMTAHELWEIISQKAKKFVFSVELGKESKYKHYQGVMSLITKEYFATVKNWIGDTVHLEPCKDWFASIKYCSKSETHVEGPYTETKRPLNMISELRKWQLELRDNLNKNPDDRSIVWYVDRKGGAGKTQMCKWLAYHMEATIITNGGVRDIAMLIPDNPRVVVFNFGRTKENFISYEAIEGIKDGLITSSKYESRTKVFDSPHVVIFANFEPEYSALSEDRWKIIKL